MKSRITYVMIGLLALLATGISPNLFVAAQAGYASLSSLALEFLIPSIIFVLILIASGYLIGVPEISRQIRTGILAGFIATIGLEIVRETGYRLGGMPGEMPELMGVLLLNRFGSGPDLLSNLAGWGYHFWNGASFGVIYSILAGRGKVWIGILYALTIATGFMMSPVVVALGVGHFGVDFNVGFPITVVLAHLAFGSILGWLVYRWNRGNRSLLIHLKELFAAPAEQREG